MDDLFGDENEYYVLLLRLACTIRLKHYFYVKLSVSVVMGASPKVWNGNPSQPFARLWPCMHDCVHWNGEYGEHGGQFNGPLPFRPLCHACRQVALVRISYVGA